MRDLIISNIPLRAFPYTLFNRREMYNKSMWFTGDLKYRTLEQTPEQTPEQLMNNE